VNFTSLRKNCSAAFARFIGNVKSGYRPLLHDHDAARSSSALRRGSVF
jgi:hypothetical protein